jgi:class 3 adenylate cyclase/tetratricopeptide (TPR) repeat protein
MRCTACGVELIAGKPFCHACGTPAAQQCDGCGSPVESTFRFCPSCGRALGGEEHATPPPVYDPLARYSQHIPSGLANKIRSTRDELAGERKQVTVLFCDLVGSTAIASGLDPEEYHDLLERYLELAFREVYRYEGIVNQLAGDGFMALFGAPVAHEDAPQRAVRAALAIREALAHFHADGGELAARIGIHTGPVVVGNVGNDLKMDYTAIGDTTNLAARLQTLAAPGTVLISETTHRLVRGFFEVRPTGPLDVKGKSEPVPGFEVLSRSELATAIAVAADRGLTPLVGRDGELALLENAFARVGERAQLVAVVGDAGCGKSRLVYEFKQRAAARGATFLDGRCSALGQTVPYYPFLTMFKHYFGLAPGDPPDAVAAKVADKLGAETARIAREYPHLSRFISLPLGDGGKAPAEELKRESFDAVAGVVMKESQEAPVVLVIEDLHWVDEPSRELIYGIIPRLAAARVMLLVTHRPDERIAWPGSAVMSSVWISKLGDGEVDALIRSVVGAPLPPELARLLIAKAEGSPFFAEEMTRGLVEEGYLVRDNGRSRLTRPVAEIPVPGTVHEVVAARLDRLPPAAKRVVQVASVLGRQFERQQLVRLLAEEEIDVDQALAALEQRGLLHRKNVLAQDEYRFGESVTQEVAYESLLLKQRRQLHERVAVNLENGRKEITPEIRALLAHHFARSDNRARALEALLAAAADAEQLPAYGTAAGFYRQAWEVAESLLADQPDDRDLQRAALAAANGICRLTVLFGQPHEEVARRAGERGRALAEALGDYEALASHCYFHGVTLMSGERDGFARGLALAEEGIAVAERANLPLTAMRIGRGLCIQYAYDGRFDLALRAIDALRDQIEQGDGRIQHPDLYVTGRSIRASILSFADELDAARAEAEETYRIARKIPNRTVQTMTANTLAQIDFLRGDYETAKRWADKSLETCEAIANLAALPLAAALAVLSRLELGERPAPERYLPPIEHGLTATMSPQMSSRFVGEALLALGDLRAAERFVVQLRANPYGGRLREALTATALGDLLTRFGDAQQAERCYARALTTAEAIGARSTIVASTAGAAVLAAARGLRPPDARQIARALGLCRELRLDRYRARLERHGMFASADVVA